jgi:hypothetical protein
MPAKLQLRAEKQIDMAFTAPPVEQFVSGPTRVCLDVCGQGCRGVTNSMSDCMLHTLSTALRCLAQWEHRPPSIRGCLWRLTPIAHCLPQDSTLLLKQLFTFVSSSHTFTPHYTVQQCRGARAQGPQCPQDSVARAAEEQFDALAKRFPTLHAAASTSASPRRLAAQHGTPPSVSRAMTRASEDAWTSQFEDISSTR